MNGNVFVGMYPVDNSILCFESAFFMNKRRQRSLYFYYIYIHYEKGHTEHNSQNSTETLAARSVINEKYPIKFEYSICIRVERLNRGKLPGKHTEKHLRYVTNCCDIDFSCGSHYARAKHNIYSYKLYISATMSTLCMYWLKKNSPKARPYREFLFHIIIFNANFANQI